MYTHSIYLKNTYFYHESINFQQVFSIQFSCALKKLFLESQENISSTMNKSSLWYHSIQLIIDRNLVNSP